MKTKNILTILSPVVLSIFILGCNLQDDYVTKINYPSDAELSNDTINEVFDNEDVKELLDKLKTKPKDIVENLDEVDSDTTRILNELNEKADELTDTLNSADFEGKSEELKDKFDEISDKLDELQSNADDTKDRLDTYERPIDEEKVTDLIDEYETHIDNLERAINRIGN